MTNEIRSHPRGPARRRQPPAQPRPKISGEVWRAALLFLVASLILSYPLSSAMWSEGPFGEADARENAWILSWVSHQLSSDPLALFDAHQYHPLSNTLALTEHLLIPSLLASPFLQMSNDLAWTYNVTLLICIVASALGMYLLVVTLTGNHLAGLLAGMFFAFVPYRFSHLHHLQLQLYAFLPLALSCLHRYLESDSLRWALCFAGCIVAQCLCGSQLAAVTLFAIAATMAVVVPTAARSMRQLYVLAAAILLALTTLYPFLRPYLDVQRSGLSRPLGSTTQVVSAELESYIASSSLFYRWLSSAWLDQNEIGESLFPGLTLVVFGTFGWVLLITGKSSALRPRSLALSYGLLLGFGIVLSLGPHTPLYPWLFDAIPIVATIRDVTPFSLLMLLSLSVFGGLALSWLFDGPSKAKKKGIASSVAIFFIVESIAMPSTTESFRDSPPEAYLWLARSAVPGAIVELPYKTRNDGDLFYARHHGFRPTLNGASLSIPPSHHLLEKLFERFPSEETILALEHLEVRYVIIHMDTYPPRELVRLLNDLARNRSRLLPIRVFGDVLVYEVVSRTSTHRTESAAGVVLDSVETTTLEASSSEIHVEVHLTTTSPVSGLRVHYGPDPKNPATHIEVFTPNGQSRWQRVWSSPTEWPGVVQLVLGLLENPSDGVQNVSFEPVEARRLQIRLRGLEAPPAISELEILGPSDPN